MYPQKSPTNFTDIHRKIREHQCQSVGDFIPINYELCIKETRQLHRVYFIGVIDASPQIMNYAL